VLIKILLLKRFYKYVLFYFIIVSLETSLRQYLDLVYVFSQDLCEREIAAAFLFNILWPTCCLLKKSLNDCNLSERLDLREIWVSNIFVKTALEHVIFSFGKPTFYYNQ
jgi:uncharacterized membrane protein YhaH (DUF805 family)